MDIITAIYINWLHFNRTLVIPLFREFSNNSFFRFYTIYISYLTLKFNGNKNNLINLANIIYESFR